MAQWLMGPLRLIIFQGWSSEFPPWSNNFINGKYSLVAKLKSIFTAVEHLNDVTFNSVRDSLSEFFQELCKDQPGVVAVRQSFKSFQALRTLDLRNQGIWEDGSTSLTLPSGGSSSSSSDSLSTSDHGFSPNSKVQVEIWISVASHQSRQS